jgi:hypothetical protein
MSPLSAPASVASAAIGTLVSFSVSARTAGAASVAAGTTVSFEVSSGKPPKHKKRAKVRKKH